MPNPINFSFSNVKEGVEISGESLLMRLDLQKVSISLGSACSAGMIAESHVLKSIGRHATEAKAGVRITLGRSTNKEDLEVSLAKIVKAIHALKK